MKWALISQADCSLLQNLHKKRSKERHCRYGPTLRADVGSNCKLSSETWVTLQTLKVYNKKYFIFFLLKICNFLGTILFKNKKSKNRQRCLAPMYPKIIWKIFIIWKLVGKITKPILHGIPSWGKFVTLR